jgi:ferredoxin
MSSISGGVRSRSWAKGLIKEKIIMNKQVVIDTYECTGCESCVELCPEIFEFDDENEKAVVILPEGGDENCIEEAISTCPVECISWDES